MSAGLIEIPVGRQIVAVPDAVRDALAAQPPGNVSLSVSRVWLGRRSGEWVVHFGAVRAQPSP